MFQTLIWARGLVAITTPLQAIFIVMKGVGHQFKSGRAHHIYAAVV